MPCWACVAARLGVVRSGIWLPGLYSKKAPRSFGGAPFRLQRFPDDEFAQFEGENLDLLFDV